MLGERVERAATSPGVEDVPHVGALVRRVDRDGLSPHFLSPHVVAEARDLLPNRLPGDRQGVLAGRDPGGARIAAEVHVYLLDDSTSRLEPRPADEIGAVRIHGATVEEPPGELSAQRMRKPRRAIHRRIDLVGELLPARSRGLRADGRRRLRGRGVGSASRARREHGNERGDRHRSGEHDELPHPTHDLLSAQPSTIGSPARRRGRRAAK